MRKEICIGYAKEDCATTYIVKSNDSCDDIASAHGLNSTILYLNNPQINQDCSNIYIGEVLCTSKQVQVPPAPGAGFVPGAVIPVTAEPAKPPKAPAFAPEPAKPAPTPKPTPQAPAPQAPPAPAPPAPSPAASSSSSLASSSAAPAPSAPADEEDDDDLPFCDEL
ncbi:hypothetical protein H0H81_008469 [Sphagnurus paluster]|uniref:LysM domain-containing protein n=1 Tax=Sphagnurus paluster TaxID=117069 RepID=A0A9P7GIY0_9AGAR|nr:hypothetical protein H0H81_008469 [Sphagnurus paluster]